MDSYFTMLGLQASGRLDLIEGVMENFAWLIDTYGHIPNGTRTYFFSRSQPPFFSLVVALLSDENGADVYKKYTPQLTAEHNFWMQGADKVDEQKAAYDRVVRLPDGAILNR